MEKKQIDYSEAVAEVRSECRQYAMLYFHFCKTLVEALGLEKAKEIITKSVYSLAVDRTNGLRKKAAERGLPLTAESFNAVNDLPVMGWVKELGRDHCPYAACWVQYFDEYPWFRELSVLYCNVIDTTNIENYTRSLSHKLTQNVLQGDETCDRVYFESGQVKSGKFTYDAGSRP